MFQVVNYIATHAKANANGVCARVISLLICALSIVSCEPYIPIVNLGIEDTYAIERMRTLILHPEYEGERYEWWMEKGDRHAAKGDEACIISTERDLIFCQRDTGTYLLRLNIIDQQDPITHHFQVVVWEEQVTYSPYISHVLE